MKKRTKCLIILEIIYFIVMVSSWFVIWHITKLNPDGFAFWGVFAAILVLVFSFEIKRGVTEFINNKYG